MSLRARLIVIIAAAAAVLGSALFAIIEIRRSAESQSYEEARSLAKETAHDLAEARRAIPDADAPLSSSSLTDLALPQVGAAGRLRAGFCAQHAVLAMVRGGRKPVARAALPAEPRKALGAMCEGSVDVESERVITTDRERWILALAPAREGAAFAVVNVPHADATAQTWRIVAAILAGGTLLIVGVAALMLVSLRRGAAQLGTALVALERDLRAPIALPDTEELARIGAGIGTLASHLADARAQERELEKKLDHAERLSALGRVVAGVAHEVRNPLAGIKLRLDLLRREAASDTTREDLDACLDEIARLDRLVRSLLVVGRRDAQDQCDLPLGPFVDARIAAMASLAEASSISLRRQGDAAAHTEPDALAQIVDNLLRNAIEASPAGATVTVELARHAAVTSLSVIDEGPGIPEPRAAELFEPFFTTKSDGTGLGLWISRSLATALGGSLRYVREGGRTAMVIDLPGVGS
jgi:signal transduction histidine kinase